MKDLKLVEVWMLRAKERNIACKNRKLEEERKKLKKEKESCIALKGLVIKKSKKNTDNYHLMDTDNEDEASSATL